jgi:hypothetical protein
MKKTFIIIGISLLNYTSHAQQTIESLKTENKQLKDENRFLKQKIVFLNGINSDTIAKVIPFSGDYSIKVISCKGNRANQSAKIEFVISHEKVNQFFAFDPSKSIAIDNIGNSYAVESPNTKFNFEVFTDTPVKLTIEIKGVLPGTELFKNIALKMASENMSGNGYLNASYTTEFKNLKIIWD